MSGESRCTTQVLLRLRDSVEKVLQLGAETRNRFQFQMYPKGLGESVVRHAVDNAAQLALEVRGLTI